MYLWVMTPVESEKAVDTSDGEWCTTDNVAFFTLILGSGLRWLNYQLTDSPKRVKGVPLFLGLHLCSLPILNSSSTINLIRH